MKVKKDNRVLVINDKLKDRYVQDLGYTVVEEEKKPSGSTEEKSEK